jgi:hypothetical protein
MEALAQQADQRVGVVDRPLLHLSVGAAPAELAVEQGQARPPR